MDSSSREVAHDLSPVLKIYKGGRIERLIGFEVVPPSLDPTTQVQSRVVVISNEQGISARIYIPNLIDSNQKLPLLVYFHGGDNHLNLLVSKINIIAVSVHYRIIAPEDPAPIAHEDSWTALRWVASHFDGNGPDEWLNRHAHFGKVFFSGDRAEDNLAAHMAIRVGTEGLPGLNLEGIALVHPFFLGIERIEPDANLTEILATVHSLRLVEILAMVNNLWLVAIPTTARYDPLMNPANDPNLERILSERVFIFVAENDVLNDRDWSYSELPGETGWHGVVEVIEAEREGRVFHLLNPNNENALAMFNHIDTVVKHARNALGYVPPN